MYIVHIIQNTRVCGGDGHWRKKTKKRGREGEKIASKRLKLNEML